MRAIVKGAAVLFVGCVALRGAAASPNRTVSVPGDFDTIQAALVAAGPGAVIEVGAGSYAPVTISELSDVTIRGVTEAVIDGGSSPAISVIDGERIHVEGFTVLSDVDAVSLVRGTDISVRDLTVQSAGDDGISIDTVTNVVISGNRIESAHGTGIDCLATTAEVHGPLIVTSNTVLDTGGDAIRVTNAGDGAYTIVSDNVIAKAGGLGIYAECGVELEMERNDVSGTEGTAISAWAIIGPCTVSDNDIADCGGGGIVIRGCRQSIVTDNRVGGIGWDGITVAGPEVRVDRNTVTSTAYAGIRVQETSAAYDHEAGAYAGESVGSNVVTQVGGEGIILDHVFALDFTGNKVTDAGIHGVDLVGAQGVSLKMNVVTGASNCGFRLVGGARGNSFAKNKAKSCGTGLEDTGPAGTNRFARSNRFGRHRARR